MGQPNCIRTTHPRAYAKEENMSNEENDKNEGVGGI